MKQIKQLHFTPIILLMTSTLLTFSCRKQEGGPNRSVNPGKKNFPPFAELGSGDIGLLLPEDSIVLTGYSSDPENKIVSNSWKKINGPLSYTIDSPNSNVTRVRNLQKGLYQFEFTVTDDGGLTARDIINVKVFDAPAAGHAEEILRGQLWTCGGGMGCYLEISCFKCYVPTGVPFKIQVKNVSDTWVDALPDSLYDPRSAGNKYFYRITTKGDLLLFKVPEDEKYTDILIRY